MVHFGFHMVFFLLSVSGLILAAPPENVRLNTDDSCERCLRESYAECIDDTKKCPEKTRLSLQEHKQCVSDHRLCGELIKNYCNGWKSYFLFPGYTFFIVISAFMAGIVVMTM